MKILPYILTLNLAAFSTLAQAQETTAVADRSRLADQKYEDLFGSKRTSSPTDPEFMNVLQHLIFGEVFYVGNLDDKSRELITVVSLTALQTLPQLKSHVAAALNAGNSPLEIREAIYQCALFIGFPRTLNAIGVFNEVMTEKGISLPLENAATVTESNRFDKGAEIQNSIYGTEVKTVMQTLPGTYKDTVPDLLTGFCFGDFYTRNGLSVQQRELLSLVVLTALGAEKQLKAHIIGSMKAGNSKETLLAAMVQAMPYIGLPNALTAINLIKEADIDTYKPIYEE